MRKDYDKGYQDALHFVLDVLNSYEIDKDLLRNIILDRMDLYVQEKE